MATLDKGLINRFRVATPVPPRRKMSIERHETTPPRIPLGFQACPTTPLIIIAYSP